jgi:phage-related protein
LGDVEFRLRELERRVGKNEDIIRDIPVMARALQEIEKDVTEVRDENRSMRRAFYTLALSIVGSSILFALTVNNLFQ